jgi:hypothetical protein
VVGDQPRKTRTRHKGQQPRFACRERCGTGARPRESGRLPIPSLAGRVTVRHPSCASMTGSKNIGARSAERRSGGIASHDCRHDSGGFSTAHGDQGCPSGKSVCRRCAIWSPLVRPARFSGIEFTRVQKPISAGVSSRFHLSSASLKNIPLSLFPKSMPSTRVLRFTKRGASRSSRTLSAGCGGRIGSQRDGSRGRTASIRTAKPCGPGIPVLMPRAMRLRIVADVTTLPASNGTGARKPVPGESAE